MIIRYARSACLVIFFSSTAFAQEQVGEIQVTSEVADEVIEAAQRDPNLKIQVKDDQVSVKRTPLTDDPPEPSELQKDVNYRRMFEISFGIGRNFQNKKVYEAFNPKFEKTNLGGDSLAMNLQAGFRPPVGWLKRLLLSGGVIMRSNPPTPHKVDKNVVKGSPPEQQGHRLFMEDGDHFLGSPILSAEWDTLIFQKSKSTNVVSVGLYRASETVVHQMGHYDPWAQNSNGQSGDTRYEQVERFKIVEWGPQIRLSNLHSERNGWSGLLSFSLLFRYGPKTGHTLSLGFHGPLGKMLPMKRRVTK